MQSLGEPLLGTPPPSPPGGDRPTSRRRGLLPGLCLAAFLFALIASPSFRADAMGVGAEALTLMICIPILVAAVVLMGSYIATLILQPNTLGPMPWYLTAFLQGALASLLLLLSSPLVGQVAHALQLDGDPWRMAFNVTLPVPVANGSSSDVQHYFHVPCVVNASAATSPLAWSACLAARVQWTSYPIDLDVSAAYVWWLPAAVLFGLSTTVFILHLLFSLVLFGCLGATPAMWRHTQIMDTDEEAMATLRDFVGAHCDTQRGKYEFGMALRDAWRVSNPELESDFDQTTAAIIGRAKPSNVHRFFHGTSRDSARAIISGGFRLPPHRGMFGKGVYFADCPLKSLQYTGWAPSGWRYMLVCDVELGNTLVQTSGARPEIDPSGGQPITQEESWLPSLRGEQEPSFDSVSAPAGSTLRVPEYIVYSPSQAVPRFILAVEQVPKRHPEALTAGAGGRWLEARQRDREERQTRAREQQQQQQQQPQQPQPQPQQPQQPQPQPQQEEAGVEVDEFPAAEGGGGARFLLSDGSAPTRAAGRPVCKYGGACYRRNPQHWSEFDHPTHAAVVPPAPPALVVEESLRRAPGWAVELEVPRVWPLPSTWQPHHVQIDAERAAILVRQSAPPPPPPSASPSAAAPSSSPAAIAFALPLEDIEKVDAPDPPSAVTSLVGGSSRSDRLAWQLTMRSAGNADSIVHGFRLIATPPSEQIDGATGAALQPTARRDRLIATLGAVLDRLPRDGPGSGSWQCPACTLTNPRGRDRCEACEAARPERRAAGGVPLSGADEAAYLLSRPVLSEAEQRRICGLPALSRPPAQGGEAAEGAPSQPSALARLRDALCSGSRIEVVLKAAVLPLVLPIGFVAGVAYFTVTRSYRLLRYLLLRLPACVAHLFRSLATAITAVCRAAVALAKRLQSCWLAVLDFVARHCKSLLFAVYDTAVAPVFAAVDRCVLQPLRMAATGCARAAYAHIFRPLGAAFVRGIEACLPVASRALTAGCSAIGTVAYEVDCALTEGAIRAAASLWRALQRVWDVLARTARWVWHDVGAGQRIIDVCQWLQTVVVAGWDALIGACRWLEAAVLLPGCEAAAVGLRALGRALHTLGGAIGSAASWAWTRVLAPLGTAAWGGVSAAGSALGSALGWLIEHAMWPLCVAVGRASVEVTQRAAALCSALAGLVGACCSALGRASGAVYTAVLLPLGSWVATSFRGAVAVMAAIVAPVVAAAAAAATALGAFVTAVMGASSAVARAATDLLLVVWEALQRCVGAAADGPRPQGAAAGSRRPATTDLV